ncbi:phosphatase PAP2 family protein [Sandaracinus amylolyticus]|uniref:Inositolphosphotransferase Aur1/Ipt1 domain-containing protein n=1 Tax=Sandaracinus amylolyticus TaxID=927083 RepID=A0A0F6YFW1_9BACT|nr:phosphatase PAP2 family protein [Sandaracinus amylolyticus]AKF04101.1 Hypothetical protein DB32_001250 [Sandaracinus amylolyticus]
MDRDRFGSSLVELGERLAGFGVSMLTILVCYGASKIGTLAPYRLLPLTALDLAIPYWPWTVWIYGTATWAVFLAWAIVPSRLEARRLWASIAIASITCAVIFMVFPTTYPRALYPTPDDGSLTALELADLRDADTAANCVPSLHVALAALMALSGTSFPFARAGARRALVVLCVTWATLVALATLTVKQHYVVDVPSGALVGALAWWSARRLLHERRAPFWARYGRPLALLDDADRDAVAKLRRNVEAHQWSLDEIAWPERPRRPISPLMERLLNEVVYIEEIARLNFELLRDGSADDDLRALYGHFADEERRHAEALRRVIAAHGGRILPPGLGNALVLSQFDRLDPRSDADVALVALSTPVFETFLDAGTIPFLRHHPEVKGALLDALEQRISRDEHAHLALNWIVSRHLARTSSPRRALRWIANPMIHRGILAVPFMSLDVYALAYRLGFDFRSLLPAFGRLWRLHHRFPELASFPLWWLFRLFVACGVVATTTVLALHRANLVMGALWTTFSRVTRALAIALFGRDLLARRTLPPAR